MKGYDTTKNDIKGGESPKERDEHFGEEIEKRESEQYSV